MFPYQIIIPVALGMVGIVSFTMFAVARARMTSRYAPSVRRSPKTAKLVYILIPVVLSFFVVPALLADLFWRTLGTAVPLIVILLLSAGLGFFLVRLMKGSSLFAAVEGRDRAQCCFVLFIAILIYPSLIVLVLNDSALHSPAYSRTAIVTNKITGGDKSGRVHDYVAFKGDQISEFGGVQVSPVLYQSVEPGSKVVVYLKTGWLGFPVVVGVAKG